MTDAMSMLIFGFMRTLWLAVFLIAVGPVGVGYHYYRRSNQTNKTEVTALLQKMAENPSKLRDFVVSSHPRHQPGDFEGMTIRSAKFKYALGENMVVDAKADVVAVFSFKYHRATVRIQMAKEGPPPKAWNVSSYELVIE